MRNLLTILALLTGLNSTYSKDYDFRWADRMDCHDGLVARLGLVTDTTDMDASTTWYGSSYIGDFSSGDCRQVIGSVKVVRDTLIGDRLCRILGVTSGGTYIKDSELPFYLKGGIMSFYEDEKWKQLYDFNAEVGDTVTYHLSKNYPYYDLFGLNWVIDEEVIANSPYSYVIHKADTIITANGKNVKRYSTTSLGNAAWLSNMRGIIADVGSLNGLFGMNYTYSLPECSRYTGLRCYSDDETDIRLIDEPCDRLVAVDDVALGSSRIYPNPGSNYFTIETDASQLPFTYRILDVMGKMMSQGTLVDTRTQINTDTWSSGMYFMTIYNQRGYIHTYKWMKE